METTGSFAWRLLRRQRAHRAGGQAKNARGRRGDSPEIRFGGTAAEPRWPLGESKRGSACKIAKKRGVHITHQTLVLKSRKVY